MATEEERTPTRSRDPRTGILLPKRCRFFGAGHTVHWIPGNKSAGEEHRSGVLAAVEGNVITIDFGDEIKEYRNHDPDRLLQIIKIGGRVAVCEEWVVLRARGYLFSSADIDRPWSECVND